MNLEVFDFFSKLEPKTKEYLKMRLHPIEVPENTTLFFQDDICDSILFLTSGEIELVKHIDENETKQLYTLKAGEQCIVNIASTLSQTPALASATTTTPIEGYIIDMYSLKDLMRMSEVYQGYVFSLYKVEC
ncbi:cyclic nucleotide-binding domain-containing protein [Sulfurimonas sp. C5]|uniref:Crp/Fnr family transcriptional regulator n=1 Tax=Sulfurimonas sp. C5 TaxID=3036947 RepID=UPI0024572D08|nr:cyclic nucleotide-binding domain-containing protein [Sulfurimonas sp. C5]MDH4944860.1 cyclic nucleotide-binding domain-containing protein [Sulfurimonas sp. C5]